MLALELAWTFFFILNCFSIGSRIVLKGFSSDLWKSLKIYIWYTQCQGYKYQHVGYLKLAENIFWIYQNLSGLVNGFVIPFIKLWKLLWKMTIFLRLVLDRFFLFFLIIISTSVVQMTIVLLSRALKMNYENEPKLENCNLDIETTNPKIMVILIFLLNIFKWCIYVQLGG